MKDKIREIIINDIAGKSALENWGVKSFDDNFPFEAGNVAYNRIARLVDKIIQATRLDEEKVHILIFKHTEQMLDNPDDDGIYPTTKFFNNLKKAICSQQDELTKEE